MECIELANTGTSMYVLIAGVAILLVTSVGALPYRSWLLPVAALLFLGLYSPPLHAQTVEDCTPAIEQSAPEETSDITAPQEFTLTDDTFELRSGQTRFFSLLQNDNQLSDDLIDWTTVDLKPNVAGIQDLVILSPPGNPLAQCGTVRNAGFGTVEIYLNPTCSDDSELPESFSASYTAQTQSSLMATIPAVITILFNPSSLSGIVTANNDIIDSVADVTTIDILANDTTTSGELDPLTIDLDLATPGRQTTVSVVNSGGTLVLSVNSEGVVTADYTGYDFILGDNVGLLYVVSNTDGDISNIALIRVIGITSGDD
ncbi:hypothetical protein KBD20_00685 [Candidatus Saccharibacteria bacterium]|nr:hypothetical protein [Candidatus Saccharibacteria bacterium]